MKLNPQQVQKVAKLANIPVSEEEVEKYSDQLSKILDYIDQLNLGYFYDHLQPKNLDYT